MTLIPSVELQKAIYSKLSTAYKVVQIKSANPSFPFIEIGNEVLLDDNTKTEKRTVHNVTIHTYSKSTSSIESKTLNHFVKESILGQLEINGFYVDKAKSKMVTTLTEEDVNSVIWHGVLQFELSISQK